MATRRLRYCVAASLDGFIATADGGAALNPTAGQITTALAPRQMQLAVRLVF
jgi:hypothetical protein